MGIVLFSNKLIKYFASPLGYAEGIVFNIIFKLELKCLMIFLKFFMANFLLSSIAMIILRLLLYLVKIFFKIVIPEIIFLTNFVSDIKAASALIGGSHSAPFIIK